jgi:hypothetical protein
MFLFSALSISFSAVASGFEELSIHRKNSFFAFALAAPPTRKPVKNLPRKVGLFVKNRVAFLFLTVNVRGDGYVIDTAVTQHEWVPTWLRSVEHLSLNYKFLH